MSQARRILQTAIVVLLVLALMPGAALAQEQQDQKKKKKKKKVQQTVTVEAQALYDQGKFEELVGKVAEAREGGASVNPDALYLDGLARQRLQQTAEARQSLSALAERPEDDPWRFIGQSALRAGEQAVGDAKPLDEALAYANRAVELAPANKFAHFQRGRVLTAKKMHAEAAQAYVRALEIDGNFAYAHYYAGMSYHESRNLVAAANHLTRFLQLAPEAPERVQVQGILATIQG